MLVRLVVVISLELKVELIWLESHVEVIWLESRWEALLVPLVVSSVLMTAASGTH